MSWKNCSYTKKGAIIGLIVGIILLVAHLLLQSLIKDVRLDTLNDSPVFIISSILIEWPFGVLFFPVSSVLFWTSAILCGPTPINVSTATWLGRPQCILFNIYPALSYVGYFITALLAGLFIGWIIGKMKSRKLNNFS